MWITKSNWTVFEETRMGNMGLTLRTVQATIVTRARARNLPLDGPMRMCDLSRWQPDWVAISHVHKRIAIIDLYRPSDVHKEQLYTAALRKQEGYSPLIYALDYYINQGWTIHVFPFVVGIRGLIHIPHIHALLKFLDAPRKYWATTVESTVLASVKAFYFLHRVRFGGLPTRGLLEPGLSTHPVKTDDTDTSDDENPHSAPEHWGKRGTRQGTLL